MHGSSSSPSMRFLKSVIHLFTFVCVSKNPFMTFSLMTGKSSIRCVSTSGGSHRKKDEPSKKLCSLSSLLSVGLPALLRVGRGGLASSSSSSSST